LTELSPSKAHSNKEAKEKEGKRKEKKRKEKKRKGKGKERGKGKVDYYVTEMLLRLDIS